MNMPKLRFKADNGSDFPDWNRVRIGDLGCFIGGLTFKKTDTIDSAGLAVLTATNIGSDGSLNYKSEVQFVDKKAKPHQYLIPNDIVICKSNGSQHLVGKAAKYDGGYSSEPNGITVGAFCGIFRSPCPIIPFWFQSDDYKSLIKNSRQGEKGSLSNIKGSDIENHYATLPTSYEEQRKISEFLDAIDDIIAKQQAEIEAWKQYKKGVAQKLFSQEVRFKADDGSDFPDWEIRVLNEICNYSTVRGQGKNYISTENMLKDFYGVNINSNVETKGVQYQLNDTLLSNIRPYLRKAWLADRNGVCSSDVLVLHPTNVEPCLLYYLIANDKFIKYVMTSANGTKMPRGDKTSIMNYKLELPCQEEQRKIVECLGAIDDVIALSKAELEKWRELKKGLLQQLFV